MDLLELRNAIREERIKQTGRSVLIWGLPRTGKTRWAATIAMSPHIKRVFYFDFENGWETIIYATNPDGSPYFSDEELAKIQVIRVLDLPKQQRAVKTTELLFSNFERPVRLNGTTGDFIGKEKTPSGTDIVIQPDMWTSETAIVLDTIGQIGVSALNLAESNKPGAKDKRQWYMEATNRLNNIFTMIQASPANVIACTHVVTKEIVTATDREGNATATKDEYYPLCLSIPYAMNVGKSFGSIINRSIELNKFAAISTPTKKRGIQAGTRTNIDISGSPDATLPEVLKLLQAKAEAEEKPEPE